MSGLIDGLPDAVALRCLARVPYNLYPKLELVSRSWKAAIRSAELFRVRQEVGSSQDLLCVSSHDPNNTWRLYDPLQNLWITLPELPSKRRHLASFGVVSISQKLFVLGGRSEEVDPVTGERDHKNDFSTEVWSYDLITRTWSIRAPMLVCRALFACCVVDGKIVVAGGCPSISKTTNKAEMYDTEKDVWIPLPDLLQTQNLACGGLMIGGKMHIVYRGMSTVEVFDSSELKWRVEDYDWPPGPKAVVGDSVYVICTGLVFKLDGRDKRFVTSASQFRRRIGMAMVDLRGELYVIGGLHRPEFLGGELLLLSDVHVLKLRDETPTWYCATPMNGCHGTVFGCTVLRI